MDFAKLFLLFLFTGTVLAGIQIFLKREFGIKRWKISAHTHPLFYRITAIHCIVMGAFGIFITIFYF